MPGSLRKHRKRIIVLTALSVVLLGGLIIEADPTSLARQLASVDLGLMAVVVVLYILSILARALRWHVLLWASDRRIPFRSSFLQFSISQALNDLTPVKVVGDLARVYGVNKERGVPVGSGLATIIAEKIMDLTLVTMVIIAALVPLYPEMAQRSWATLTVIVGVVTIANAAVIVVLLRPRVIDRIGDWAVRLVRRWRGKATEKLEGYIVHTVRSFNQSLVSSKVNRGLTMVAAVLTVPIWGLEFARLMLIMAALGSAVPFPAVVVASTLAITVQVFLPAGSGNVAVITEVFSATGIALATATAAGLLSIATSIWLSVPLALVAMVVTGMAMDRDSSDNASERGKG